MNVSISQGNSKMGSIPSVSLPAGITCRDGCTCIEKCYARRLERLRPNVREAYHRNYMLYRSDPNTYWREVEAAIMVSRFFRFHVSGDIPDVLYLDRMSKIAWRNPHCQILCFTKQYELVNAWLADARNQLPENLHLIFSAWRGIPMDNPHNLPEAHVLYRDGATTASLSAKECGGNCTECAVTTGGCWSLRPGEEVVFREH